MWSILLISKINSTNLWLKSTENPASIVLFQQLVLLFFFASMPAWWFLFSCGQSEVKNYYVLYKNFSMKSFSRKYSWNHFHGKFNLYSKIKGACQDIPYDHVEDEDGLMLQQPKNSKSSGLMTIVKIKKKACVCLKDLNQLDDYDNFVWRRKLKFPLINVKIFPNF